MCELFGASLKRPVDLRKYLAEFYSHSVRHPHGWGLMSEKDGRISIVKEEFCAAESETLSGILEDLPAQKNVLAHIRYATVGAKCIENSHPFSGLDNSGRRWTLIHNGTVYSGFALMKYFNVQTGKTDSERIFLHLLNNLNCAIEKDHRPDAESRFAVVEELVNSLSYRNKLNLMIFDGELLYVHKNMKDTLSYKKTEDGILLSTEPLEEQGWSDLPMCRLYAFRQGEKVLEGRCHGNEFIPTLGSITAADAMHI